MPDLKDLLPSIHGVQHQLQSLLHSSPNLHEARNGAIQAWNAGLPRLTVQLCDHAGPGLQVLGAIALNRLGEPRQALQVLEPLTGALVEVHRASSFWALGDLEGALHQANLGLRQARQEGHASAIVSGVCIAGEVLVQQGEFKKAVLALAEAFKIAEMTGEEADPYALAITAEAHILWGSHSKARQTLEKVRSRTQPHQLAHVRANITEGKLRPEALSEALQVAQVLEWGFWSRRIQGLYM